MLCIALPLASLQLYYCNSSCLHMMEIFSKQMHVEPLFRLCYAGGELSVLYLSMAAVSDFRSYT